MVWYKKAPKRNVVDMHITDYDPSFLSRFDPQTYVDCLVRAKCDSAVLYAHSHVGFCTYSTKTGVMHPGLKGRDIFAEVNELCRRNGIAVVAYYSLIYNSVEYGKHPDWRIICSDGTEACEKPRSASWNNSQTGRYGVCCPNSPYRDFVVRQIKELCSNYSFEGIRFDMTFWPYACYCSHCRQRFAEEFGGSPPTTVDWENRAWVGFQRKREEWLNEFAALCTDTVRDINPQISVEHQSSSYPASWKFGVTVDLRDNTDFLQGDFYGNELQGAFICKLLNELTPNKPFGFETSICRGLGDHTSRKSSELMTVKAYAALANQGAFIFIDGIDPAGTLNPAVYETMRKVFEETDRYRYEGEGELCSDVGIYFSTESKFDPLDGGKSAPDASERMPHLDSVLGAVRSCIHGTIPYGVITRKMLDRLDRYPVIVLPNVLMMSRDEVDALQRYVAAGGALYASLCTSLYSSEGERPLNYGLSELFGADFAGTTRETITYIEPIDKGTKLMPLYSSKYPLCVHGRQVLVKLSSSAAEETDILGRLVLPYTDPLDTGRYASIHSNPPGITTDYPSLIFRSYGKGKVVFSTADLEKDEFHEEVFLNVLKLLHPEKYFFSSSAPKSIEITMFHHPEEKYYTLTLLNFQKQLPNIPVYNIDITANLPERIPNKVTFGPNNKTLSCACEGASATFTIPRVENFERVRIFYE